MGEVYLAEDTRLHCKVALKLLPTELTGDEDRVRRFTREARSASTLDHPNIITIHEISQTDNRHYIVTEFIEGETLRQKLSRGPLAVNETLEVAIQMADALAAAHAAGIVHRDIKPEKVLVRGDGLVKVLDFGLAKLTERRPVASNTGYNESPAPAKVNTDPGTVMGTVDYLAREQARGWEVEVRADLFNLGMILYEMLTGRAPFVGETPGDGTPTLLEREPAPIARLTPGTPADLRHIVNKALRKDKGERYQSAESLLADLKALKRELEFATNLERHSSSESLTTPPRASGGVVSALPEAEESDGLDLAHVLFCDIVGYSLLPIDQQAQMMRRLQEIVRQTEDYRRAEASQQLVRLPAGDGMALAFLHDLSAPVRCALEIARALKSHPEIRLRIGVHSGPVYQSADINANRNVVGSGINLAQRVMDCGDAGHILVSRNVAEALSQVSQWQPLLHELGEVEVKHGVRLRLSNLYDAEIGNAEMPTKLKVQSAASAGYLVSEIKRHRRGITAALLIGLLAVIGLGYWFFSLREATTKQIESIAVMPFVNESGNADLEYLSDGMTETLISSLSHLQNISVKARSSVFRYKGKEIAPKRIGQELSVQAILSGRVRQDAEQLKVSLELVDAETENLIWSEQYHRRQTDLASLQHELALDVVEKLRQKVTDADEKRLGTRQTENTEAYHLYLQGRYQWNKRTKESLRLAVEYFQQAIDKDPSYALAYSGLADCYSVFNTYELAPPNEAYTKARIAAQKALEIDPRLGEAYTTLADVKESFDWDFQSAQRDYQRAIALAPNYATARQWYGELLRKLGRLDEAVVELRRAQELDPVSPVITSSLGLTLFYARRYDQAIVQLHKALEMDANFAMAHRTLGWCYTMKGMYDEAVAEHQKAVSLSTSGSNELASLAYTLAKSGKRSQARKILGQLNERQKHGYVDRGALAKIYFALGEKEEALANLEKAYQEKSTELPYLKINPAYDDEFRSDPLFQELLRKVGLQP